MDRVAVSRTQSARPQPQAAAIEGRLASTIGSTRCAQLRAMLAGGPSETRLAAAAETLRAIAERTGPAPRQGRWRVAGLPAEAPAGSGTMQMKWVHLRDAHNLVYWDGGGPEPANPPEGCRRVDNPHAPIDPRAGQPPSLGGGGGFLSARPDQVTAASFGVLGNLQYEPHLAGGRGYSEPVHSGVDERGRFVIVRDATGGYVRLDEATQYGMLSIFSDAPDSVGPRRDALGAASASSPPPGFPSMAPDARMVAPLDASHVRDWSGVRKGWSPDQQGAMGNLSAADAARAAGVVVTGSFHWLHLIAFSMGGLDKSQPNVPENLVVGTMEANMIHGVVEKVTKRLATSGLDLELSVRFEGVIDAARHVFHRLHYFVRNRRAPFWQAPWVLTLELLDHNAGHHGDFDFVYRAMETQLTGSSSSGSGSTSSQSATDGGAQEDPELHHALVQSVQDIAGQHGVSRHFTIGHADGRDDNCSILSVFAAAGARISRLEAMVLRDQLQADFRIPTAGPLDLADHYVAAALQALLSERVGHRAIVVIHPGRAGEYALTSVAGSGSPIFLFYASGHFSPAVRKG